jgi:hypothetical protein
MAKVDEGVPVLVMHVLVMQFAKVKIFRGVFLVYFF